MAGLERPQEHAHDASDGAGTPGSTGSQRLGSSVRFQHQIDDADFAPVPPAQGQQAQSSQRSIVAPGVTPEQLKDLTTSIGAARLQGLRVANFAFEPMSLPASRVRVPPSSPLCAIYSGLLPQYIWPLKGLGCAKGKKEPRAKEGLY